MCGCTISSATDPLPGGVGLGALLAQKGEHWWEELVGLFHVRHMPALMKDDAVRAEGTCRRLGGGERDGVPVAVQDDGGHPEHVKRGEYVVVAERLPDGLLDAA